MDQMLESGMDLLGSGTAGEATVRPVGAGPVSDGYDVHELWYRLSSRPWSCLVVVSPDRTPNTLHLARSLADVGAQHRRRPIEVIDGPQLDPQRVAAILHK